MVVTLSKNTKINHVRAVIERMTVLFQELDEAFSTEKPRWVLNSKIPERPHARFSTTIKLTKC